jgi:putative ABC transport system permease protein
MKRRSHLDSLDQEIRDHIEAETQDNLNRGMTQDEARRAAFCKFGNVSRIREDTYAVWHVIWLEQLLQDIRYGARTFRRNPGFAAVIFFTLALAIGMNTAVLSIVEAVLFRPLPYPSAGRLVWLASYDVDYQSDHDNLVNRADYSTWRDRSHSFESIAAYGNQDLALMYKGQPSQERVVSITGGFWNLTGAQAVLGRLFPEGEPHAIVLSHELFQRRFNGDPHTLGQTVTINGFPFTITGVLPKSFEFLFPQQYSRAGERRIDAYIAFPKSAMRLPMSDSDSWKAIVQEFGPMPDYVCVVARLRPAVSLATARSEMDSIRSRIVQGHGAYEHQFDNFQRWRMKMLKEKLAGGARPALMVLLAAVGFVLLIAGANIANLLLARATTRRREIAVRAAMGAGRTRVIRQFLTEGVLLALAGGAAGLLLARGAIVVMIRDLPHALPRLAQTRIDGPILLLTAALSCFTGILFGLPPAVMLWHNNLQDTLKVSIQTSTGSAGHIRTREVLVAIELALAVVLLTGAGLMVKGFRRMTAAPPGFDPSSILTLSVSLAGAQYGAWPAQQAYIQTLLARLQAFPGVEAAGIDSYTLHTNVKVEGLSPDSAATASLVGIRAVSAGYLRVMGVPLLPQYGVGHWPSDRQMLDDVLVNESFARSLSLKAESVVGRHISGSFVTGTIIGVVADFKYSQLDAEPVPEIYTSYELAPVATPMLVDVFVRTSGSRKPDARTIEKIVANIDRTQPVYNVQTLEQSLAGSVAPRRFNLFLLGIFAGTALLLAVIGIYGVVAYSVALRTQEIGIRMALGASRPQILGMVIVKGLSLAAAGILLGTSAALGLTHLMVSLLYNVTATDPTTFVSVALLLVITALLACLEPALRAALIDPMIALRHE